MLRSCSDRSRINAAPILILCSSQGADSMEHDAIMLKSV